MTEKSPTTLPFAVSAINNEAGFAALNPEIYKAVVGKGYAVPCLSPETEFLMRQRQAAAALKPVVK